MKIVDCDYFVVGSGMAGLMSALHLASYGKVVLATKGRLQDCNTNFAQGGICCVADAADTFDKHARDTMIAGAWLGKSEVVHEICEHAPEGIQDLIDCGVKFAKKADGTWDLTREGGHSARRIFHAGDITGEKCEAAMIRRVRRSPVDVREQTIVIDLVMTKRIGLKGPNRCIGAYVMDKPSGEIYAVRAPETVLATGGCGKVYLYTCNPDTATGDGIALAWRAGAKIENMEFIQFHPTCLYHPQAKRFLISEAVRGEGAVLVNRHGREFMKKYDPRGSLAPRDIVARSIDSEMKRTGDDCVYLDIGPRVPDDPLSEHLPQVHGVRHRHGEGPHPGRPGGALHVRRHPGDDGGRDVRPGALRRRRMRLHGAARREPPGVELADGGARVRAPRGRPARAART